MVTILTGDCREVLRALPDASVNCCVTSPPYWGLRDYGHADQIGQESTPEEYVASLVAVFREVRRVLRADGTLWLNLGDSYCSQGGSHDGREDNQPGVGAARAWRNGSGCADGVVDQRGQRNRNGNTVRSLKPKDLVGVPWRVAFALQSDGWWLRSDIIWHKPNPTPESVTDRPTKSHEYIFLLSKSATYYYDAAAIAEASGSWNGSTFDGDRDLTVRPSTGRGPRNIVGNMSKRGVTRTTEGLNLKTAAEKTGPTRNRRDVWTVTTSPYSGAHFATFPPALIVPCILAGCPAGGTVLDPFGGSGTTGDVASGNGRRAILIELNPEYAKLAQDRCGLFCAGKGG